MLAVTPYPIENLNALALQDIAHAYQRLKYYWEVCCCIEKQMKRRRKSNSDTGNRTPSYRVQD
jgi:hypothetical protein